MPTKLTTTIKNIESIPNYTNVALVKEFYQYMKNNGASERHQNNNIKAIIAFAKFLGPTMIFIIFKEKSKSYLSLIPREKV
jgi:hypothetical protein